MTLDKMMRDYQVVAATDLASTLEQELTGIAPYLGQRQFLTAIVSDSTYSLGGFSGNPIGLNIQYNPLSSCIQVDYTGMPHFAVFFHEMGHNFQGGSSMLYSFFAAAPLVGTPVSEGFANMCVLYTQRRIMLANDHLGLGSNAVNALIGPENYDTYPNFRDYLLGRLNDYEKAPSINSLDEHILDGMMIVICDNYGWECLPRFYSIFLPVTDHLPFDPLHDAPTFLVASLSAAFQHDLLPYFRDQWRFPIDQAFYDQILPELTRRAALRDLPRNTASLEWLKAQ